MGRYLLTVFVACLIFSPSSASAAEPEKPGDAVRFFGTFAPEPGAWSEYAIFDKATGDRTVMRLAIVGAEGDSYWYEVAYREGEGSSIVKMLVTGDPIDPENIQRLIMKSGIQAAREVDRDSVLMDRRKAGHLFEERSGIATGPQADLQNVKTGEEVVTVPAGTFDVELHQIVDTAGKVYGAYKFSREVHPFGVVASDAGNTILLLVGRGTGAMSLITEEPAMMTRPPGMLPGMEPGPAIDIKRIPGMGTGYEPRQ